MAEEKDLAFVQLSQLEHLKKRSGMYVGSTSLQTLETFVINVDENEFNLEKIAFSPALIKIFSECVDNAFDHYIRNQKIVKSVKNIKISFDKNKKIISVYNDGPGIPIKKVKTLNNGEKYHAEAIFTEFLAGSNFEKDEQRESSGMNGIGIKATVAFSSYFKIETLDNKTYKYYKQKYKDGMTIIEDPEIKDVDKNSEPYTLITFKPDYKELGYKNLSEENIDVIDRLLKTRAFQMAAFLDTKCKIFYNDVEITFPDDRSYFEQFSERFLHNGYGVYKTILKNTTDKKLDWEICIGISEGKYRQFSLVNDLAIYDGGNHIDHIQNEIVENIRPFVEKEIKKSKSIKFNKNMITNNLFLFMKGTIINPQFDSQTKTKIMNPIEGFADYKFKQTDWKKIWEFLEPHIMSSIFGKIKDKAKTRVNRGKVIVSKGSDAKFAGDKKLAQKCTLFIAEGDSALGLVENGINHKKTELERDYCGTYSIQGVPPNARKEVRTLEDKKTKEVMVIRNTKLKDNKRFEDMVKLLGLDYQKKYTKTKEGDEEFKTLRYGRVVVATDQDVDGKGQIFGMILNFFELFWPCLIERNYINRFNTPVIRAYPINNKELVKEFFTLYAFEEWIKEKFEGDDEEASKKYKIKYYKGLASHDVAEIRPTFSRFENKLYKYDNDKKSHDNLEIYFGKDPELRKDVLATPVDENLVIKDESISNITVSNFLQTDVKEFQRDNIIRKLPHIMDGMVPSRRKVFFVARMIKGMATKEIKVVNFTGDVISKGNYHHGDASLSGTIIKMCQNFVGARNLPLMIGVGNYGSRLKSGEDAGSPRYIQIKYNKKLGDALFPQQDDFLLPYVFEDGVRSEPQYYIPILPYSILENMMLPATGWRIKIWARDYKDVIKNVRKMITGEYSKPKKMGIWLRGNNSEIRIGTDQREYMVGKYTLENDTVTITELPLGVYNNNYIKSLAYNKDGSLKSEFKDVNDYSNYDEEKNIDEICIKFDFCPGILDALKQKHENKSKKIISKKTVTKKSNEEDSENDDDLSSYAPDSVFDYIEEFMKLRVRIDSDLNMIDQKGEVKELTYYGTVVGIWFEARKKLYSERMDRLVILSRLYIKYLENIIRFSEERDKLGIKNSTPEKEFNSILEKKKYDKFNKTLLISPKYTKVEDLENMIINGDKCSYEYIISLTYRSLLAEANIKRKEELDLEKKKLDELLDDCQDESFKGKKQWLKELEELEKIIEEGVVKGWNTQKNKPRFE